MLQRVEFYNCPDGTINIQRHNEGVMPFDETCQDIVQEILITIRDLYPGAFASLSQLYSVSQRNKSFFEYRIVHRFIRCNFGEYDSLSFDVDAAGNFNFEKVKCPLRGECKFEGVICLPVLQSNLTARENEVVTLLLKGYDKYTIAEELEMSPFTVTRHFANIRHRLGLKSTSQIITHFNNGINNNH